MSVAAINSAPVLPPVANVAPPAAATGQGGAAQTFASYSARSTGPDSAAVEAGGQAAPLLLGLNARVLAHLQDTINLQNNVKLLERADTELNAAINRVLEDRTLGPKSEAAKLVGGRQATFDFIVAEAKRTGLFDDLKDAGIQRLKDSGNYESLIDQVMAREARAGRPRDRAWAESWIGRQFDPTAIDAAFQAGEPYMDLLAIYEGAWAYGGNKGCAAVYGDKTNVQATGPFKLSFVASEDASDTRFPISYIVENQLTGEKTAPRPYDERGTIIETKGLRAQMFGNPAAGDIFTFDKPAKYQLAYPDGNNPIISKDNQKEMYKTLVFNRLFDPIVRGPNMDTPEETVDDAFRRPIGR